MREGRKTVRRPPGRLSDSLFRRTVEDAPLGISVSRGEHILYANKAWRRLFGLAPGTRVVGLSHMVFVAPEEQKRVSRITSARQSGEESPASYDTWVVRADGARIPLHVSVTLVDLEDGRAELVFLEDISERRQAEERLRWLSLVAEQVGEGVTVADLEGNLTFVNKAWASMHSFKPEELVGQHLSISHSPDQIARDVLPFNEEAYKKGKHNGEVGHIRRDGTPFPTEMTSTLLMDERGQVIGLIGFAKDITERKRAEEALHQSEERFRKIFEESPVGMALTGRDLHFSDANSAFCGMLGYTLDELKALTFMDVTHPDDLAAGVQNVQKMLSGELSLYRTEKRYVRKDGYVIWGALTLSNIRDSEGVFQYFLVMVEDVTERKAVEEALRGSEERFRTLAETTAASILIFRGSHLLYANPEWERSRGRTIEEARRMELSDFIHPDHRDLVRRTHQAISRGEVPAARYEIKILTKEGEERWMDSQVGRTTYQDQSAVLITAFDITDRKKNQAELERRNKELMALVASAQAMTGFLNLEEAARAICKAAVEAFEMKMVWIGLVVPESTEVKVLASYGYDEGYTRFVKVRWDESSRAQGPCGRAIKTRKPVVMWPGHADFAPWRAEAIKRGYRAVCALSMIHEDTVRGVITFYSEDTEVFSPEAIEILEIFARQATMAVVNASLYGEASISINELNEALQELQKSQEALKEREERYRGLVENAKGIMLLWTPDLKVTYWNDYAEEFFGFTKEEILGRSLIGTIVPRWESSGRDLEVLLRRIASDSNTYASNINQNVTKDGRRVWVAWTNRPIVDAEGRTVVILSHGTDITALKEAEVALRESEERYRVLVETSPEAIIVTDLLASITMVNRRALEMWGTEDASEIVGRSVLEFVTPEDRLPLAENIKLILARGFSRDKQYHLLRKDGTSFPAEINGSVIKSDEGIPKGMMGVLRDITDRKNQPGE